MMLSPTPALSFLFLLDWEDGTLSDLRDGGQSRRRIPSGAPKSPQLNVKSPKSLKKLSE
jgi:hypothetical protein